MTEVDPDKLTPDQRVALYAMMVLLREGMRMREASVAFRAVLGDVAVPA